MRRFVLTLVAALALTLSIAGAASANVAAPGTIGETNCQGQTTAFMAQKYGTGLATTAERSGGRTVLEEVEWIYNRCNP